MVVDKFCFLECTVKNSTYDAEAMMPVMINFDAQIGFAEGSTSPSLVDLFRLMEDADYQDYITNYVWVAQPEGSIFVEVNRAVFRAALTPG